LVNKEFKVLAIDCDNQASLTDCFGINEQESLDYTIYQFVPLDLKLDSKQEIGNEFNLSRASITRYLRINKLIEPLKSLVDEGKIVMRAGVDLSYLSEAKQEMIDTIVSEDTFKIDMKTTAMIRDYDKNDKLDWKSAKSIITGEALKDPNKIKPVKVAGKGISRFFGLNQDSKEIEEIIEKALEQYFQREQENNIYEDDEGEERG